MEKKVSSLITLLLFVSFLLMGIFIGEAITKNEDLINIIAQTGTLLALFFYFRLKKMGLQDINFRIQISDLKKFIKIFFYCEIYSISANFMIWFFSTYTNLKFYGVTGGIKPYNKTYLGWIIFFMSVSFLPAVVEEIVFRGVLLKNLTFKYGFKIAVLVTSIIFSLMHGVSDGTGIFLSGFPFYLAYIYYKENNILYPILIHGVYNFIAIFPKLNYLPGDSPKTIIYLFILSLPFILKNLYKIFILEKNNFKF